MRPCISGKLCTMKIEALDYDEFDSPIGRILLASDIQGVCALDYDGYQSRMEGLLAHRYGAFRFRRSKSCLAVTR